MTINPNISQTLSELKHELQTKVLVIEFTKKDGSVRTMTCTNIPERSASTKGTGHKNHRAREQLIVTTDLKVNEWRSFNFDQITSVSEATE
jgi:hypothetical protein